MESVLSSLRAVAESTRLRLLLLCAKGQLTVTELTDILGQSQPRVSRHLKLLCDAGLLDRFREGTWVYYRLAARGRAAELARQICAAVPSDDATVALDQARLDTVKRQRADTANAYFRANAAQWDQIRSLHIDEREVEAAVLEALGGPLISGPVTGGRAIGDLLDLGTGTGRMLEIAAPRVERAIGIDLSREMLAMARANLEKANLHNCTIRQGDIFELPFADQSFDAAIFHQVLHYADRPSLAVAEAARMVRPEGRLVIVDFAPHALEFLREDHAHRHLGFADAEISNWCREAELVPEPVRHLIGQPLTVSIWVAWRLREAKALDKQAEGTGSPRRGVIMSAPAVSFEFFPPKTAAMEQTLWQAITSLAPLGPRFVSVTYGAGGSTRERTHATVARIRRETALEPAAHLTCVGASRGEIDAVAQAYWDAGIRHIVALRGDPPAGAGGYRPHRHGYAGAVDLVAGLKRIADFEISVAAYPETHPEALSDAADLDNLKRKLDAGATRAITQFFFDVDRYLRFRDRVAAAGIAAPIVPGILPIIDFAQAKKFATACGAAVPARLEAEFADAGEDTRARAAASERVAVAQCSRLIEAGIDALHFYTLNRAECVAAICTSLGIGAPAVALAE